MGKPAPEWSSCGPAKKGMINLRITNLEPDWSEGQELGYTALLGEARHSWRAPPTCKVPHPLLLLPVVTLDILGHEF